MTSHLATLCFAALDPLRLAGFWGGVLGREPVAGNTEGIALLPDEDTGFVIRFLPTDQARTGPNQMHVDLTSSSLEDQEATVARALELGGSHLDIGQGAVDHVVLSDPEGNEFDVIEPGNSFLAGCGFIGALASDGTREVGYFWSRALGWPLVWDQDEETAIQSPDGGTKISWGGPPVAPKRGRNRLHFDLAPTADADLQADVDRLVLLGATVLGNSRHAHGAVDLADPDGNEFCLLRRLGG